jgi:hypothetical protein
VKIAKSLPGRYKLYKLDLKITLKTSIMGVSENWLEKSIKFKNKMVIHLEAR